ncbi:PhaM family polyhydroxyalkanoate granule multifunctional regulatory protein [Undibacterium rugosum]|uniref:PhaM family polyhydroxyalkanoate granule multifunctional regulatory protein n=1 Tax=Undibacterium rugosum TaxID=2762291 RepID=UPI001B820AFD|nr:PhaM family polyhydroxyalkanoate granule multifunctional regulatory protein [Undibacterium rugosum]MBR7779148.1 hypothetical protein [Undibacterium rugosum]
MQNPFTGAEAPGLSQMADPLGFIKKLWGSMQVPGMVTPPMSLDELDKKIQDLKTVESWLNVNMNMLRGTIQTLEVQRATLAALQSLGDSFVQQTREAQQAAAETAAAASAGAAFSNAGWPMSAAAASEQSKEAASDTANQAPPDLTANLGNAASAVNHTPQNTASDTQKSSAAEDSAHTFSNPAVWWNLLQDQFKQAVSQAIQSDSGSAGQTAATPTAVAPAAPEKKSPAARASNKPAGTKRGSAARPVAGKTATPAKAGQANPAKPVSASKAGTVASKKTQSRPAASTQMKTSLPLKTKTQAKKPTKK